MALGTLSNFSVAAPVTLLPVMLESISVSTVAPYTVYTNQRNLFLHYCVAFINITEEQQQILWVYITDKNVNVSPDGWAEGVFEASGRVSWLWCLKGLPESSGSAVWRLQGCAAGPQGQSHT